MGNQSSFMSANLTGFNCRGATHPGTRKATAVNPGASEQRGKMFLLSGLYRERVGPDFGLESGGKMIQGRRQKLIGGGMS